LVAIATILVRTIEKCLFDSFLLLDEWLDMNVVNIYINI
jgi:hypothetical protein